RAACLHHQGQNESSHEETAKSESANVHFNPLIYLVIADEFTAAFDRAVAVKSAGCDLAENPTIEAKYSIRHHLSTQTSMRRVPDGPHRLLPPIAASIVEPRHDAHPSHA
ncbi:MAG TPA: hypothetical protein VNT79_07440, partial [Phycisphaerae bacterium]|nr:hypothetical protein [Phycisphaerae bacterium]